jgi:hypothetical protein
MFTPAGLHTIKGVPGVPEAMETVKVLLVVVMKVWLEGLLLAKTVAIYVLEAAPAPNDSVNVTVWVGTIVCVVKLVTLSVAVTLGSEGETDTLKKQLLPLPGALPPVPMTREKTLETLVATPAVMLVVAGTAVNDENLFAAKAK